MIGRTPYYIYPPSYPNITISNSVDTNGHGTAYAGGAVTIEGHTVAVTSNAIDASATGTATGGAVSVIAHHNDESSAVLTLNDVTSKGGQGGAVNIQADGDIDILGRVDVSALDASPRTGGIVDILPLTTPKCGQDIHLEDDLDTHGFGSSGLGGDIDVEGSSVFMNGSTLREMNADRQGSPPSMGSGGGTILLRAAVEIVDEQFGLVLYKGTDPEEEENWHTITALPGGTILTSASPNGGKFTPPRGADQDYLECE